MCQINSVLTGLHLLYLYNKHKVQNKLPPIKLIRKIISAKMTKYRNIINFVISRGKLFLNKFI